MTTPMPTPFGPDEAWAIQADRADPLAPFRARFAFPSTRALGGEGDRPAVYLTGNSLGLMPLAAREAIEQELTDWSSLGVEGHFHARNPWFPYHEPFRALLAPLVGARPQEVVAMNSLTVNLHLLMLSFYRPTSQRFKIIIEDSAFPSDSYAVASQAALHGHDPAAAIVRLKPRAGEQTLRTPDIMDAIAREGPSLALVMLSGVNYLTGQAFDIDAITRAGHAQGACVGWDLAHAVGNLPLRLHDAGGLGADFAVWCSYKYLNAGPGAVAGAFVHERHHARTDLVQLAGWWGNDPATRFRMTPGFVPAHSADRWALSNPPVFALAPLRASLRLFAEAGMDRLRTKSLALTGYLQWLLDRLGETNPGLVETITPRDPAQRGCQLSLRLGGEPRRLLEMLKREGVVCDFREPDVIRAAPVPLYCSFQDVWRFVDILARSARPA
jgi:kynureninase